MSRKTRPTWLRLVNGKSAIAGDAFFFARFSSVLKKNGHAYMSRRRPLGSRKPNLFNRLPLTARCRDKRYGYKQSTRCAELQATVDGIIDHDAYHVLFIDLGPADGVAPRVTSLGKAEFQAVERNPVIV